MIKERLKSLITVMMADNKIDERERDFINKLAVHGGLSQFEIDDIFDNIFDNMESDLSTLSNDQKFEHLYNMVQLMKIDKQIFKSEIQVCKNVAKKLGFNTEVISFFSSKIYSDPSITSDRDYIYNKAKSYLK